MPNGANPLHVGPDERREVRPAQIPGTLWDLAALGPASRSPTTVKHAAVPLVTSLESGGNRAQTPARVSRRTRPPTCRSPIPAVHSPKTSADGRAPYSRPVADDRIG